TIGESLDTALFYAEWGLDLASSRLPHASMVAKSLNNVGICHMWKGNNLQALSFFQDAASIFAEMEAWSELGTVESNMAVIFNKQEEYEKALFYLRRNAGLFRRKKDTANLGITLMNLGYTFSQNGQVDSSLQYYHEALSCKLAIGQQEYLCSCYSGLGSGYLEQQAYARALPYFRQAWTMAHQQDSSCLIVVSSGLGAYHLEQGNLDSAAFYFLLQKQWAHNYGEPSRVAEAEEGLAETYERKGDYQAALKARKAFQLTQDTLLRQYRSQHLDELSVQYETARRERDIAHQKLVIAEQEDDQKTMLFIGLGLFLLMLVVGLLVRMSYVASRRKMELSLEKKRLEANNLRELNELKSRLFANISHEFRTPLTLILGPLQKLLAGPGNQQPDTLYYMMQRNAHRLQELINQLLDLSKLEAGKMVFQPIYADVVPFLKAVTGNFESLAEDKSIKLHLSFPAQEVLMLFDPDRLEMTLNNLLSNAFKYTPEKGNIWVKVEAEEERLEILVQDNGIGMDEEQLAHIFDRFYQAADQKAGSSGIGLALVKEVVQLFEGEISVSSEVGSGSTFVVHLPRLQGETPSSPLWHHLAQPENVPMASPKDEIPLSKSDKASILLVEDNADVRRFVRSCLEPTFQVREAIHGQEGLELAQAYMPDLIISDVMMPEMDGNELCETLKKDQKTAHIPLILLTAKAGRESKLSGLKVGADDYLHKPFDREELILRVGNLIEQRKRIREQLGKNIVRLSPEEILVDSADEVFLRKVMKVIETYLSEEDFTIEDMGREVGMSRVHLHRKLKALTDQSPSVFLRSLRLKRASQLLKEGAGTASEIAYMVGFSSPAYFSKCFKDEFGQSPGEFARSSEKFSS
ncbi:MAG: ATP-binding protein, partial [Bacteroidota bacterium]